VPRQGFAGATEIRPNPLGSPSARVARPLCAPAARPPVPYPVWVMRPSARRRYPCAAGRWPLPEWRADARAWGAAPTTILRTVAEPVAGF